MKMPTIRRMWTFYKRDVLHKALRSMTAAVIALLLFQIANAAQPHRSRHFVVGPATGPTQASVEAYWVPAIKNEFVPGYPVEGARMQEFAWSRELQRILLQDMKPVFGSEWQAIMSRSGPCGGLVCAGPNEIPSETHYGWADGPLYYFIDGEDNNHLDVLGVDNVLGHIVRRAGWVCTSINSVVTDGSGRGFNLYCNHGTRVYQILSDGQHWVANDKTAYH